MPSHQEEIDREQLSESGSESGTNSGSESGSGFESAVSKDAILTEAAKAGKPTEDGGAQDQAEEADDTPAGAGGGKEKEEATNSDEGSADDEEPFEKAKVACRVELLVDGVPLRVHQSETHDKEYVLGEDGATYTLLLVNDSAQPIVFKPHIEGVSMRSLKWRVDARSEYEIQHVRTGERTGYSLVFKQQTPYTKADLDKTAARAKPSAVRSMRSKNALRDRKPLEGEEGRRTAHHSDGLIDVELFSVQDRPTPRQPRALDKRNRKPAPLLFATEALVAAGGRELTTRSEACIFFQLMCTRV
jgi:hypothetical protein